MLAEMPAHPFDKTGWPWTEETPPLPPTMPDGSPWPKISIVTPSFNQGQFIEETIRSVLLQGYPNLEYIIIDGGSTDGSVEIIKKYEPWLAYWVSEPDNGQSHAINKGFAHCTGKIIAWINSDDFYTIGAFTQAALAMSKFPDVGLIHGNGFYCSYNGKIIGQQVEKQVDLTDLLLFRPLVQPSIFFRKKALDVVGSLREDLYYRMDFDISLKIAILFPIQYIDYSFSSLRIWLGQKTFDQRIAAQFDEEIDIREKISKEYSDKNVIIRNGGRKGLLANLIRASICCFSNKDVENGYRFINQAILTKESVDKIPVNSIWLGLIYSGLLDKSNTYQDVENVIENVISAGKNDSLTDLLLKTKMRVRIYKAIQLNIKNDIDNAKEITTKLLLHDTQWVLQPSTLKFLIKIIFVRSQAWKNGK